MLTSDIFLLMLAADDTPLLIFFASLAADVDAIADADS